MSSNRRGVLLIVLVIAGLVLAAALLPERDDDEAPTLEDQIEWQVTTCRSGDEVRGVVVNTSPTAVDIFIEIRLLDADGTQVGDTIASVSGLAAGGRATWDVGVSERFTDCRARVSSVFPAD